MSLQNLGPTIRSLRDSGVTTNTVDYVVGNIFPTNPPENAWCLNWAQIIYSSAGAGNRIIEMQILDENLNQLISITSSVTQAGGLVRTYKFIIGNFRESAFSNNTIQLPMPAETFLLNSYTLRFVDINNIDVNDSMVVSFQFKQYFNLKGD